MGFKRQSNKRTSGRETVERKKTEKVRTIFETTNRRQDK